MKRKQMKITGMGLMAVVSILGIQTRAAVIAFDGFDTAASADPANGIYKQDLGVTGTSHTGGNIVGFDASDAWILDPASGYPRAYNNQLLLLVGGSTSRVGSRQLPSGTMSGKTVAYGSVDFRLDGINNGGATKVGFTTETAQSAVGATIRIIWDSGNSEWDLQAIYNNGSIVVGSVLDGISLDTDYNVIWGMDDASNTLKVWVDASSTSDAATATFTDYQSSVSSIDNAYFQYNGINGDVGGREGILYDNLTLGDTMADVIPEPAVIGLFAIVSVGAIFLRRFQI